MRIAIGHALHDDGVEITLFNLVRWEELVPLDRNIVWEFIDRYLRGAVLFIAGDISVFIVNRFPVGNFFFNRNSFF